MHRKCKPCSLGQNVKILAARSCSTRMLTIHGGASRSESTCNLIVDWWFIQCIPEKEHGAKRFRGASLILKHVDVFMSHLYQHEVCPGVRSIAFNVPHRGPEQNGHMNQRQLFVRRETQEQVFKSCKMARSICVAEPTAEKYVKPYPSHCRVHPFLPETRRCNML